MVSLTREILDHLRGDRRAAAALMFALSINLLVCGLYVWSRGGQTTHVRIVANDNAFIAMVDGTAFAGSFDVPRAPQAGGVVLALEDTESVPSIPEPRGIDAILVTDLDTNEVLFEDDFSDGPSADWEVSGSILMHDGVIGSRGGLVMTLPGRAWRNYTVDVAYRNVQSGAITVRARPDRFGIVTTVRPFHWNEDATKWISMTAGFPGAETNGVQIQQDRRETVRSLVAMAVRPYPWVLLFSAGALVMAYGLRFALGEEASWRRLFPIPTPPSLAVGALALMTFGLVAGFGIAHGEHAPFVPDSVAYVFQAKIFASGRLTAPLPPVEGAFDFFTPPPFAFTDDSWAAQYPFAHPLVLSVGQLFGVVWLMPALLAAGSVALIYATGAAGHTRRVGMLAAVLLASSPFFLMNAVDLMSHNTAGFFLLASLACLARLDRRPVLFGAVAGLAFGLLLNTRPLTAAALTVPFGLYLLSPLLQRNWRQCAKQTAPFAVAAAVMALLFLGWNYTITGDAFTTGYQSSGVTFFPSGVPGATTGSAGGDGLGAALGSGGLHRWALGLQSLRTQMGLLLLVLNGWPVVIGLTFSALPFLLGTRRGWDWFLLGSAVAAMVVWVRYESTGVMYGPRYWYESMPFLLLLAARGADRAADLLGSAVAAIRERRLSVPGEMDLGIARIVVYGFVAVLVLSSAWGWMLGRRTTWEADLVPNRASAMCCVLGVDDRIHRLVEAQDLHNALVLVDPCGNNFVCFGSVFWRNNPTLDGDIVYAKDISEKRDEIIAAYPGRAVYLATYPDGGTLRALGSAPPPGEDSHDGVVQP